MLQVVWVFLVGLAQKERLDNSRLAATSRTCAGVTAKENGARATSPGPVS